MENQFDKIMDVEISEKMKTSYIDYAMSVIVARALPDVRDGLKPVHRRILYAMNELNLDPSKGYKKCARIVGDTMGKYHPHGDAAIYDALVRLAQNFSMRYPLVDGHGNFGNIDGYPAAAQRYTEARMSRISLEMLADIDKNTVNLIDTYDGETKEPEVLPSRFPNLLVNGSSGIAVGMATNIPPHNLTEVIDGIIKIIDNRILEGKDTDIDEITSIIKGPDFPTGATILGKNGILSAYRTGRGKINIRSEAEIETLQNGRERIIITEIPYQVNKSRMIEKIAELVKDKKVEGISSLNDETSREGIRVVIECKREANATVILNQLYKYSSLQESYTINFLAIVNGEPKILNLKDMLIYYIEHQEEVVTRRTKFDLDKALKRAHIVEGFLKALDHIDEVINIIRSSQTTGEAKERLKDRFDFTEAQVTAIVEMRLRSLTGLEREKLENEYSELMEFIAEMRAILSDKNRLFQVIKDELLVIRKRYGDDRKTKIIHDFGEIDMEDLIEDEMSVVTLTRLNYIKRIPLDTYKSQNRGGKGIIGMQTRDEDLVKNIFLSSNHDYIFLFTSKGKVYKIKTYEIPEAGRTAKGTPIINLLNLLSDEKISAVIPIREFNFNSESADVSEEDYDLSEDLAGVDGTGSGDYLVMTTKKGIIKKVETEKFSNIRTSGLIALNLKDGDELISVKRTDGKGLIFIATKFGMTIKFDEKDVRAMGRTASGVHAIKLRDGDEVIASEIVSDGYKMLIVSEKGFGKCTSADEFRLQSRGGFGTKGYKITEKTGNLVGVSMVNDNEELMMITSDGVVIRIRVKDISNSGRVTQGVKLINVGENVKVMSIAKIEEESLEPEDSEEAFVEVSDENE
ncbi:MAG: DNA gyrase subunit A [Clostridiales bacterium]|nr:DNA gyrase subunit A [Clostridiales bacterium]